MDYCYLLLKYIHMATNPNSALFCERIEQRIKFDAHLIEEANRGSGRTNKEYWLIAKKHLALVLRDTLTDLPSSKESEYSALKEDCEGLTTHLKPAPGDSKLAKDILKELN